MRTSPATSSPRSPTSRTGDSSSPGTSYADLFAAGESPVLHFWSLAIEEQFYFIYPLLIFLLVGVGRWSRTSQNDRRRFWFHELGKHYRQIVGITLVALVGGLPRPHLVCRLQPEPHLPGHRHPGVGATDRRAPRGGSLQRQGDRAIGPTRARATCRGRPRSRGPRRRHHPVEPGSPGRVVALQGRLHPLRADLGHADHRRHPARRAGGVVARMEPAASSRPHLLRRVPLPLAGVPRPAGEGAHRPLVALADRRCDHHRCWPSSRIASSRCPSDAANRSSACGPSGSPPSPPWASASSPSSSPPPRAARVSTSATRRTSCQRWPPTTHRCRPPPSTLPRCNHRRSRPWRTFGDSTALQTSWGVANFLRDTNQGRYVDGFTGVGCSVIRTDQRRDPGGAVITSDKTCNDWENVWKEKIDDQPAEHRVGPSRAMGNRRSQAAGRRPMAGARRSEVRRLPVLGDDQGRRRAQLQRRDRRVAHQPASGLSVEPEAEQQLRPGPTDGTSSTTW